MKVTREVIIDLLPLYVSGEASADTRALVEEYLKGDPELARSADSQGLDNLTTAASSIPALPADADLKALRRTRSLLRWQRRLFAWALALSLLPLSSVFSFEDGHVRHQFLLGNYPAAMLGCLCLGIACWVNYFAMKRRLQMIKL